MSQTEPQSYTAFDGNQRFAQGSLEDVVLKARKRAADEMAAILLFNDSTGRVMDFDLNGTEKDVLRRLQIFVSPPETAETKTAHTSGPGRPKLGVVAREVSLLPRHWEWLATQSGGASATLRRLVEEARKELSTQDRVKQAQERAYRFMSVLAGDLPGYEEALRALYKKDERKFKDQIAHWPSDVRSQVLKMARGAFGS